MDDKIKRMVNIIKRLSAEELAELNKRLRGLGLPPLEYSSVPASPKPTPPQLTDAIGKTLDGKPLIQRP